MEMEPRLGTTAMIAAVLLLSAPLAGCVGFNGSEEPTNDAPTAALSASTSEAWTGQEVSFDAGDSADPDGEVASYVFDFGDGNTTRVDSASDPIATHTYAEPGAYTVQVTVTDDGGEGVEARSDTASIRIAIHEEVPVEGQVLAIDAPGNQSAPKTYTQTVAIGEDADRFELKLNLSDVVPVGASEVTVRVLDPSGAELAADNVTTSENATVELSGELSSAGDHTIEVTADTGGATFEGVFKAYTRTPDQA